MKPKKVTKPKVSVTVQALDKIQVIKAVLIARESIGKPINFKEAVTLVEKVLPEL